MSRASNARRAPIVRRLGGFVLLFLLAVGCDQFEGYVQEASLPPPSLPSPTISRDATPLAVLPRTLPKQIAQADTFHGCPPDGNGGDGELNYLKNRTDGARFIPVALAALLDLGWPEGAEGKGQSDMEPADRDAIKQFEGSAVSIVGYVMRAAPEGPDPTNCDSPTFQDYSIWIVANPKDDIATSVVAQVTPRVAIDHPGWTGSNLKRLANRKATVKISGWLLFDGEERKQLNRTRGTLWEIHPTMGIEVDEGYGFVDLVR